MEKIDMKKFLEQVVEAICGRLEDIEVKIDSVRKNNGVEKHSIMIVNNQRNITPCIYMDKLYDLYIAGEKSMDEVVDEVISIHENNKSDCDFDVSLVTDYEKVKPMLRGKLINTERNTEYLESVPHRKFLDLSVIYLIEVENFENASASITIKNEHMKMWGVSEDILYNQVKENMHNSDNGCIAGMAEVLKEKLGEETDILFPENNNMMYIISNKRGINGAVEIMNENLLKNFADSIEKDIIIIPSSVHECILLPVVDDMMEMTYISGMVREVNNTEVDKEDILSYHVYKYERSTGMVTVAA